MIIFDHKEGGGGQANDQRMMLMDICGGRGVHDDHLKIKRIGGKLLEFIPCAVANLPLNLFRIPCELIL